MAAHCPVVLVWEGIPQILLLLQYYSYITKTLQSPNHLFGGWNVFFAVKVFRAQIQDGEIVSLLLNWDKS